MSADMIVLCIALAYLILIAALLWLGLEDKRRQQAEEEQER